MRRWAGEEGVGASPHQLSRKLLILGSQNFHAVDFCIWPRVRWRSRLYPAWQERRPIRHGRCASSRALRRVVSNSFCGGFPLHRCRSIIPRTQGVHADMWTLGSLAWGLLFEKIVTPLCRCAEQWRGRWRGLAAWPMLGRRRSSGNESPTDERIEKLKGNWYLCTGMISDRDLGGLAAIGRR
jgi:hypothetical protein